jgi:two-component system, chemotaxis family, sensor kinase CheA
MMDTSQYMPMFLAEAQEHLQELNLAVVRLEHDASDSETVNEIFRIAHSIKGMSATMGFSKIALLTHEMEDVFELLRQRTGALPSEVIDTVLACLDALSGAIESLEASGAEELDPVPLIDRLHGLVRPRTPEQQRQRSGGFTAPDLAVAQQAGERVLHVVVTLSDVVMMPAVRAHMVFAALVEHGEIIGSAPSVDDVENFTGRQIEAWLISEHEEEAVAAKLGTISDVSGIEVTEAVSAAPQLIQAPAPPPVAAPAPVEPDAPPPPAPVSTPEAAPRPAPVPTPDAAPAPAPVSTPDTASAQAAAPSARSANTNARTVRVDAERLDALMHSMGELVIHRTAVEALTDGLDVDGLQQAMQELTRSSQALQAMVMQVRMIPVEVVFLRFPRLVRDLSSQLGKEVTLDLVGSDTELDRTVVDALGDPLVHLVRNSLDHGLEPAAERADAGKPSAGTLQIAARHAGGSVIIEVRDDGRGIDPARVAAKAVESGLIDAQAAADVDMKAAVELLFTPGFSTVETTNDISGRGVGMDAVRAKIRELGGEVVMDSELGCGTLSQIRLPLTLAIVAALQVEIAGGPYAIPVDRIERTLRLSQHTVRSVAGRRMLVLEDGVLPLVDGGRIFGRRRDAEHEFVVIVRADDRRVALAVDDLIGQRELVTRPLPAIVSSVEPVSGGAALADGRIALIIDCDRLDPRTSSRSLGVRGPQSPSTPLPPSLGQLAA